MRATLTKALYFVRLLASYECARDDSSPACSDGDMCGSCEARAWLAATIRNPGATRRRKSSISLSKSRRKR